MSIYIIKFDIYPMIRYTMIYMSTLYIYKIIHIFYTYTINALDLLEFRNCRNSRLLWMVSNPKCPSCHGAVHFYWTGSLTLVFFAQ